MGCDYYADEHGVFEQEFTDYETGRVIARVYVTGLTPRHKINRETVRGDVR